MIDNVTTDSSHHLLRDRDGNGWATDHLRSGRTTTYRNVDGVAGQVRGQNQIDLLQPGKSWSRARVVGLRDNFGADFGRDHTSARKTGGKDLDHAGRCGRLLRAVHGTVLIEN